MILSPKKEQITHKANDIINPISIRVGRILNDVSSSVFSTEICIRLVKIFL